ncbi:MAG: hypothetical protein GY761_10820, partial [Hyphomicrobiales bacterium]|nr:hypothetical protein [Hyphomicrobiales bacterium]
MVERRTVLKGLTGGLTTVTFCTPTLVNKVEAAEPPKLRGTGDLGVIIERASGSVQIVETTTHTSLAQISELGDLSHASMVFSRDERYAFVFGRDGGLSKIDLLTHRL